MARKIDNPDYLRSKVETLMTQSKTIEVIDILSNLSDNLMRNSKLQFILALAYLDNENYPAALDLLLRLQGTLGHTGIWNYHVACTYYNLGNYDKAKHYFQEAITLKKGVPPTALVLLRKIYLTEADLALHQAKMLENTIAEHFPELLNHLDFPDLVDKKSILIN